MKPKTYSPSASLERMFAPRMGSLQERLNKEFDLTKETAKRLGTKGNRLAKITDRRGEAKTGGDMLTANLACQRYISYTLRETHVALRVELEHGKRIDEAYFVVTATPDLSPAGRFVSTDYDQAVNLYVQLLSSFAPLR